MRRTFIASFMTSGYYDHITNEISDLPFFLVKILKIIYLQYLEDKAAKRLLLWDGKCLKNAGRKALVKSVLTSQAIYPLTTLDVPVEPRALHCIQKKSQEAFFGWVPIELLEEKCKVNWTTVCRPTSLWRP
jgi:hypothetical protein